MSRYPPNANSGSDEEVQSSGKDRAFNTDNNPCMNPYAILQRLPQERAAPYRAGSYGTDDKIWKDSQASGNGSPRDARHPSTRREPLAHPGYALGPAEVPLAGYISDDPMARTRRLIAPGPRITPERSGRPQLARPSNSQQARRTGSPSRDHEREDRRLSADAQTRTQAPLFRYVSPGDIGRNEEVPNAPRLRKVASTEFVDHRSSVPPMRPNQAPRTQSGTTQDRSPYQGGLPALPRGDIGILHSRRRSKEIVLSDLVSSDEENRFQAERAAQASKKESHRKHRKKRHGDERGGHSSHSSTYN